MLCLSVFAGKELAGSVPVFSQVSFDADFSGEEAHIADRIISCNKVRNFDANVLESKPLQSIPEIIRNVRRKTSGFAGLIIRLLQNGIVTSLIMPIVSLLILYLSLCVGSLVQRVQIIFYIHNQDGQKPMIYSF